MLSGMDLSMVDVVIVSLTGMVVVLFELALISLFVIVLSKMMARLDSSDKEKVKPAQAAPVAAPAAVSEDGELAAVMTVVIEESGHKPEEIVFKSIVKK